MSTFLSTLLKTPIITIEKNIHSKNRRGHQQTTDLTKANGRKKEFEIFLRGLKRETANPGSS